MQPKPRPVEPEEESGRSRGLTIAIAVCGGLAVIAIIVLVVLLAGGNESPAMVQVPNFVGEVFNELDPDDYENLELRDEEYRFDDEHPAGEIIDQDPQAGEMVEMGTTINLVVSNGPQTSQMLDLQNRTEEQAREALNGLELSLVIVIREEYSQEIEAGRVTRTDPEMDATLTVGQTVTLWISRGPLTMVMDDLTDEPQANAETILRNKTDMNLDIRVEQESSEEIAEGRVIRTEPAAGETVEAGQTVTLYVSTGSAVVMTRVPEVKGMDIGTASSLLTDRNLKCDYTLVDSNQPKDQVLTQSIDGGTEVPEGTTVELTVSRGPAETTRPTETTPAVTHKTVTLVLPSNITEAYQIQVFKDGSPCADQLTVEPGTTEVAISLEGSGTDYFDFYVNGSYTDSFKVDFSSTTAERIQLSFTIGG